MAAIQPWGHHRGDEELAAVGVGTGIRHGEVARGNVLQVKVLVLKTTAQSWTHVAGTQML